MDIPRKLVLLFALVFPLSCLAGNAVDINTADADTLMSIKGIGEKRAAAIIDHRNEHGSFESVDELVNVKGISQSLVDKARESLEVKQDK